MNDGKVNCGSLQKTAGKFRGTERDCGKLRETANNCGRLQGTAETAERKVKKLVG